ncbi:cytochrome c-type biogenesis protein CcmH, partial [Brucella melitensis]
VIILLIGGGALLVAFRCRRAAGTAPQPLSESEKAELSRLLDGK